MPIIKLFKKGPEDINIERPISLSLLETEMSMFMLDPDVEVKQANGPYISHLPPEREGLPKRVYFTANVVYDKK
jgi:hypothetical protein